MIWGKTFQTYLKRLSIIQNRAVKIIAGGHWRESASKYYARLNILKINDLYALEMCKFMHKCARKNVPTIFSSLFTPVRSIHARTTRLASCDYNLYLPQYRTQKLQNCLKYQGVKYWNSVPNEYRKMPFDRFKTKYKKLLISKY